MVRKFLIVNLIIFSFLASSLSAQPTNNIPSQSNQENDWEGVVGNRGPMRFIPPRIEERLISEVDKVSPYLAEKLRDLKKNRPRLYRIVLGKLARGYRWYQRLKHDPKGKKFADELWKLSLKERELALKYKESESEKVKKQIAKEIKKISEKLFDLRQEAREIAVKQLEEKLKTIKEELKEREAHREEIIQQHIDQILGKGQGWRW